MLETSAAPTTSLRLTGIVKRFGGVTALKGVDMAVLAGEVHALVGENGAGKSTLMSVAAGSTSPDEGDVEIGGVELKAADPDLAQRLGLGVVYQHTSIIDDMTVAETLAVAMPPKRRPAPGRAVKWAREQLSGIAAGIDPNARVVNLAVADRQLVEIVKALALEPQVLILDEPTESLTAVETERLFGHVSRIAAAGTAIIYISHRIPEVKRVADRVTVLRDGETRGTFAISEISETDILRLIVGRPVEHAFPDKRVSGDQDEAPVVRLVDFSGAGFSNVTLEVRPGEIVGVGGVEGQGQRDFLRALAGIGRSSGEAYIDGQKIRLGSPTSAIKSGIVYLTNDRHGEGLFMSLSVKENISMLSLPGMAHGGWMSGRREDEVVTAEATALAVKTPSIEAHVDTLSGGNQQKILFARSLLADPLVLLADEPSRGVDAGARLELYRLMRDQANKGKAVIVLSSDAIEFQGLCDRVLIFSRGVVVQRLEGDDVTEEAITGAALTSTSERAERASTASTRARLRRFLGGDYVPSVILAILIVALGAYTSSRSSFFLTKNSVTGMLELASTLAFISLGQLMVVLIAGIDLSVGPLAGFSVVLLSFFVSTGHGAAMIILGLVVVLLAGAGVGLINATLARAAQLGPVIATVCTYIALQGGSLLMRSGPGGEYSTGLVNTIESTIGPIPIQLIVAIVLAIGLEAALRWSRWGMAIRAAGSDETRAHRLGVSVRTVTVGAFVLCSMFAALGGISLGGQVGIGDPSVGVDYTLTAITAVVLGGASIFGGRGSFIGALLGALLLQEIVSATTFLNLGTQWQQWLPGALILVGTAVFSFARRSGVSGDEKKRRLGRLMRDRDATATSDVTA